MPGRIEDYAVIGNCETLALVGVDGSIDWLCLPRFDSPACFSALLGEPKHGRWLIAPTEGAARTTRRYSGDTMILETLFHTDGGAASVTDFMARREGGCDIVRIVRGLSGDVAMRMELVARFDYGSIVPWVSKEDGRLRIVAGPDRLLLDADVETRGEDQRTVSEFTLSAGQEASFVLNWSPSHDPAPAPLRAAEALEQVQEFWSEWARPYRRAGEHAAAALRSLLTLKALAHWKTGGIVAAGTTSLPERPGGARNWDYRFCWLRDATFTLLALTGSGFLDEARAWREWLLRAVAGSPNDVQTMYGVAGERRLDEFEIPWLPGYQGARPVRVGNAAARQLQLDVYGEVMDAFYVSRKAGLGPDADSWTLELALLTHLEVIWREPDEGIWEVRGGARHFTHSKVMAWVAFDRAIRSVEQFGLDGPIERWKTIRSLIHDDVCRRAFDPARNSFVQSYGASELDAALLLIPLVGFLPPEDPRVAGTLAAIEGKLLRNGLVMRYDTGAGTDGLPEGEGAFLACSFWLADNYALLGRRREAEALFGRLLGLRNDVGLLAEEYDPELKRQLGNFPQALSHLALVNTARNLASSEGPAHLRSHRAGSANHHGRRRPANAAPPAH
jgi:GH15 family glucan-1,4-alpha-glucosidase